MRGRAFMRRTSRAKATLAGRVWVQPSTITRSPGRTLRLFFRTARARGWNGSEVVELAGTAPTIRGSYLFLRGRPYGDRARLDRSHGNLSPESARGRRH